LIRKVRRRVLSQQHILLRHQRFEIPNPLRQGDLMPRGEKLASTGDAGTLQRSKKRELRELT